MSREIQCQTHPLSSGRILIGETALSMATHQSLADIHKMLDGAPWRGKSTAEFVKKSVLPDGRIIYTFFVGNPYLQFIFDYVAFTSNPKFVRTKRTWRKEKGLPPYKWKQTMQPGVHEKYVSVETIEEYIKANAKAAAEGKNKHTAEQLNLDFTGERAVSPVVENVPLLQTGTQEDRIVQAAHDLVDAFCSTMVELMVAGRKPLEEQLTVVERRITTLDRSLATAVYMMDYFSRKCKETAGCNTCVVEAAQQSARRACNEAEEACRTAQPETPPTNGNKCACHPTMVSLRK